MRNDTYAETTTDYERDAEGHSHRRPARLHARRLFEVGKAVPHGVICLVSALELYGIAEVTTGGLWVAIANKARKPTNLPDGTRVVRFSTDTLAAGKTKVLIRGVGEIAVHTPAKAIVDCFKFRRKLADYPDHQLANLIEILQRATGAYGRKKTISVSAIRKYLEVCRMSNVMGPYLDALDCRLLTEKKSI